MKKLIALILVLSLISLSCISLSESNDSNPNRELRYGMQGDDVKTLQERLIELGYYKGKLSGNFLEGTQNAVRRFQGDHGLEKTGIADPQTLSLLFSSDFQSESDSLTASEVIEPQEPISLEINLDQTLKRGDKGKDVTTLQTRLAELGYYNGPISGNYMDQTLKAVKAFQKDFDLEKTGIADPKTLTFLFSLNSQIDADTSLYTSSGIELKEPMGITFQKIPWNSSPEETVQILIESGIIEDNNQIRRRIIGLNSNPYSSLEESWFYYGSSKKEPYTYKHKKNDKTLSDKLKVLSIDRSYIQKTIGKQEIEKLSFKYSLESGSPQLVELSILFKKQEANQDSEALLSVLKSSYGEPSITEKKKDGRNYHIWYGEYDTIVALYNYPMNKGSDGKIVNTGNYSSVYFANIVGLILSDSAEIPATEVPALSPTPVPTPTPIPTPEKEDTGF